MPPMNSVLLGVLVLMCMLAAVLLGQLLRRILPSHNFDSETKETVKTAAGLVATMTALLLGLLVASAKESYDAEKAELTALGAKVVMMDRTLAHFGPQTQAARQKLKQTLVQVMDQLWPRSKSQQAQLDPMASGAEAMYEMVHELSPQDDSQRWTKTQALEQMMEIGRVRWMLFQQSGSAISTPLLIVVISWLAIVFVSFSLLAPTNRTAIVAMLLCALSVAGAIFLIAELDRPFDGCIQISSMPMQNALDRLGR